MSAPWTPELELGVEGARRLIEVHFPQLRPVRVEPAGFGWDNTAFVVNGAFVFRFPRRTIAARLLEREIAILPRIAPALSSPIPVPSHVAEGGDAFPWRFAGYRRLAGVTACSLELNREDLGPLARDLGRFLAGLHAVDPAPLVPLGLTADEIGRLDHAKRYPLAAQRLGELSDAGEIGAIEPYLEAMAAIAPRPGEGAARLVHGDLYARHLILDESRRLAGVIDWGDVHLGDPALDIAIAHAMLPADLQSVFRSSYGRIESRTWELARYRAIYHSALVAHYGRTTRDEALVRIGLLGLKHATA